MTSSQSVNMITRHGKWRIGLLILVVSTLLLVHPTNAEQPTVTPIKHVIIIMQENHSFDNYFGTYPTANGTLANVASTLQTVEGLPNGICLLDDTGCLSPYHAAGYNTTPIIEGQTAYVEDYDGGRMDGFARYSGPQSMAYFDYRQLAAYWNYAEEYGLGENYFASVLSTTTPNRLILFAGDTPVSYNYGPPPYLPFKQTLLNQLSEFNATWGYFDWHVFSFYPFIYVSGLSQSSTARIKDVTSFFQDLATDNLPAISFVMSLGSNGLDEHPPQNVTQGELWTVSVVNSVMRSNYWNSSAIFITWDEGGGYFDHVSPPQVITIDHGFNRPLHGFGQRVPFLVISPYAKENYVSQSLLNHMSLIRFIEYNWRLPTLNQYVASSNNLLDFFSFNSALRPPIVLGNQSPYVSSSYPIPLQIPLANLPYARTGLENDSQPTLPEMYNVGVASIAALAALMLAVAWRRRVIH